MVLCMNISAFATDRKIDPNNYPKDTRERYVASLALEKGISYKEADLLERGEGQSSEITKNGLLRVPPEEVIAYKTIVKTAGYVKDKDSRKVTIGTEVKYKKKAGSTGALVEIIKVGGPYVNMPGVTFASFSGGDFNVDKGAKYARISITGSVKYNISFAFGLSSGLNDILTADISIGSGVTISTITKTFSIDIRSSDF